MRSLVHGLRQFSRRQPGQAPSSPIADDQDTGITVIGSRRSQSAAERSALRTIGVGTLAIVNNAPGVDRRRRHAELSGASPTSRSSPTCSTSIHATWAVSQRAERIEMLNAVSIAIPSSTRSCRADSPALGRDLKLPVADVHDRVPFTEITYADVWQSRDRC